MLCPACEIAANKGFKRGTWPGKRGCMVKKTYGECKGSGSMCCLCSIAGLECQKVLLDQHIRKLLLGPQVGHRRGRGVSEGRSKKQGGWRTYSPESHVSRHRKELECGNKRAQTAATMAPSSVARAAEVPINSSPGGGRQRRPHRGWFIFWECTVLFSTYSLQNTANPENSLHMKN